MKGKSIFNTFGFVSQGVWNLDSRATNHMALFPSLFASYSKINVKQFITIANGNTMPIIGSNSIQLEPSISLHNVLHVSKLANIQKLTTNLNCSVTFFHSHCSF
uniref:Retrovirus-related Pol polyprotein from transposon TNT 1-94-like beta-barrel domain-containing protein n=1 Tax=Cajanus cajan TaxID=3821 RepID=A0A151TLJ1_CAJCA|nr:hypothetical protein KK1_021504 [Cajanus cajan]